MHSKHFFRHPLFLMTVKNVKGSVLLQSSLEMRLHFVKGSILPASSLVFDDNQKRQGICSSCHPSKCVCISSRDLRCFYNLKIAGRFCIQQNRAMTLHSRAMTHQKKALSRTPFFYFLAFNFGNQLPCVINSQTGGCRIIVGTIGVIAPDIAV